MKNKKGKIHGIMLVAGLIMNAIQIGAITLWVVKGIWLPFAIGMPVVILFGIMLTRMYYKNTLYVCAACNTRFRPTLKQLSSLPIHPKPENLHVKSVGGLDIASKYLQKNGNVNSVSWTMCLWGNSIHAAGQALQDTCE